MKLYLSSYRLGNHANMLKKLVDNPQAKVAVSVNAVDNMPLKIRNDLILKRELEDMKNLGFEPEELDLRNFFDNDGLTEKLKEFNLLWISGGNTFLLAKAFKQSGFEKALTELVKTNKLVYAGYSAAFCVTGPSLHGVELVDDKDARTAGYDQGEIWDGLGLIDFYPIVHFRSDHDESELVEKEYEYVKTREIPYKTFKDGDVFIANGSNQQVLR